MPSSQRLLMLFLRQLVFQKYPILDEVIAGKLNDHFPLVVW